jgi:hypothetical protein
MRNIRQLQILFVICCFGCTVPVNPDYDSVDFLSDLETYGFQVQETNVFVNHGFSMDGYQSSKDGVEVILNGETVYVYEFDNIEDAKRAADRIDGSGWRYTVLYGEYCIGRCGKVGIREDFSWDQSPHFYQKGRLIVLYIGESAEITVGLTKLLRNELAGFGSEKPLADVVIDATTLALTSQITGPTAAVPPYPFATARGATQTANSLPYPILKLSQTPTWSTLPTQTSIPAVTHTQVTPSPTLSSSLNSLRIAFIRENQLWYWTPNGEVQIHQSTELNGQTILKLSDDGNLILFATSEGLWVIRSDGSDRRLLMSTNELETEAELPQDIFSGLRWIPGSDEFIFGAVLKGDAAITDGSTLQLINANSGIRRQIQRQGRLGIRHFLSPDGTRIALSSPEDIRVVNVDGTGQRTLLTYEPILTDSEYWLSPDLVWSNTSSAILLVLPPHTPYETPEEPSSIWRLPMDGSEPMLMSEIEMIPDISPQAEIWVSSDLNWIAYHYQDPRNGSGAESRVADTDGSLVFSSYPDYVSQFRWLPDSLHYMFRGRDTYYHSAVGGPTIPFPGEFEDMGSPQWLDERHYIFITGESGEWKLWVGTLDGQPRMILDTSPGFVTYDFTLGSH